MTKPFVINTQPAWKVVFAVVSVLITLAIWKQGLENSFNRPSVSASISLRQQEMALLAKPSMPSAVQTLFLGNQPEVSLRDSLNAIPLEKINDRDRLLLSTLESDLSKKSSLLIDPVKEDGLISIQKLLVDHLQSDQIFSPLELKNQLASLEDDPLLFQGVCLSLGGTESLCTNEKASSSMAYRLIASQGLPVLAVLWGVGLLVCNCWSFLRRTSPPWPASPTIPLPLIDMVLLIGGGFVVLGELVSPALLLPFFQGLTTRLSQPLAESIQVFFGYLIMTAPPLIILRQQLISIPRSLTQSGGFLQWGFSKWKESFGQAISAWFMVLPPVLLTGWLVSFFFGDQGGSNPLLELVLSSRDPYALFFLVVTTVVLAPFFEELVFRGVLIPVLVKDIGRIMAVLVSAFIFAMAHLSVSEFPPLMVLGIGLALLRLSSGSLFACILMHALWNGVTFVNLLLIGV